MKERLSGNPAERGAADETRREALKRFGRYAAAAPTAMLLLDPRQGHAYGNGNGNGPPWNLPKGPPIKDGPPNNWKNK